MRIFVSASYSSKVNYDTGEIYPEYKAWLEDILQLIEASGHVVFCALRADQYKINDVDPADAFNLDMKHIRDSDAILALVSDEISAGVQTEIGVGVALNKIVIIAHAPKDKLTYFNAAMVKACVALEAELPLSQKKLKILFENGEAHLRRKAEENV